MPSGVIRSLGRHWTIERRSRNEEQHLLGFGGRHGGGRHYTDYGRFDAHRFMPTVPREGNKASYLSGGDTRKMGMLEALKNGRRGIHAVVHNVRPRLARRRRIGMASDLSELQ